MSSVNDKQMEAAKRLLAEIDSKDDMVSEGTWIGDAMDCGLDCIEQYDDDHLYQ